MKTILKQLTAALLLVSLATGDTIRTLRPDGGGMGVADRDPFLSKLGVTPLGKAAMTREAPAGARFVQLNANGTETLLDAAGFKTAIGASGDITSGPVTSSNGVSVIGSGALSMSWVAGLTDALEMKRPVVNVMAAPFAVVGNGVADDTAALQNVTAAARAGKRPIYAPTGSYKTSGIAFLLDWEGAELFGDGCPDRGIAGAGGTAFLHTSTTRPCIMVPADYNNVRVRDIRITGPTAALANTKTFTVDASTDTFTSTAHGYQTGDMVMVSTTGTLPTAAVHGLNKGRLYFVIRLTADTFKIAFNYTRAMIGTANDITSAGSGTHSVRIFNAGVVMSGNSLKSGASTDGQSIDTAVIDGVTVEYFNIGFYLEEFSNSSMRYSGGIYCYYGAIIDGNSASIITCPFAGVAVTGSAGLWMAGGVGSGIYAGDFTGDGDIGLLVDGSDGTTVNSCNFEARGTRGIVSNGTSGQTLNLIGCVINHHGTPTADTYALEIGPELVTVVDTAFSMVSSVTGAGIKQRQTSSRNLTMLSARTVKVDVFSVGTYYFTYTMATGGIGTAVQASGEPANVNNWGHGYRKVNIGAQDNLFRSVKTPDGASYEWMDEWKYWYDGGRTGSAAFRAASNTFTASPQTIAASANPHLKILSGGDSDVGINRNTLMAVTTGGAGATGNNTSDFTMIAKSGGNITFATATGGNAQAVRTFITPAGDLTMAAGDLVTSAVGKTLKVKSGANSKAGTFTLASGAATVANTSLTANSVVYVTLKTASGTRGGDPDIIPTASTGFTATGAATDNSTYNYVILEVN